ncbi:MAG: hypothetical protein ACRD50_05630 [Candidatus Acidiferrales bacterium]
MTRIERVREPLRGAPDTEHVRRMEEAGWKPVSLEWEREVPGGDEAQRRLEEVPYGLRVAGDCLHLEDDPVEMEVLQVLMEMIVKDVPFSRMADELNGRGFTTREGKGWTAVAIFHIFPRLIDSTPRLFATEEWNARRKEIARGAWNS